MQTKATFTNGEKMLIPLTEVVENPSTKTYNLREVYVNPEHVTAVREDWGAKQALTENRMPQGISGDVTFSRLTMSNGQHGLNMVVVGNPSIINEKLTKDNRKILKG